MLYRINSDDYIHTYNSNFCSDIQYLSHRNKNKIVVTRAQRTTRMLVKGHKIQKQQDEQL